MKSVIAGDKIWCGDYLRIEPNEEGILEAFPITSEDWVRYRKGEFALSCATMNAEKGESINIIDSNTKIFIEYPDKEGK
jgi:hypothetical protein